MKFQYKVLSALCAVVMCVLSLSLNVWADDEITIPFHDDGIVGPQLPTGISSSSEEWGFQKLGGFTSFELDPGSNVNITATSISGNSGNLYYMYRFNSMTGELYITTSSAWSTATIFPSDLSLTSQIRLFGKVHSVMNCVYPNISGDVVVVPSNVNITVHPALTDYSCLEISCVTDCSGFGATLPIYATNTSFKTHSNGESYRYQYNDFSWTGELTGTTERGNIEDFDFGIIRFDTESAFSNFVSEFKNSGDISDFFYIYDEAGQATGTISPGTQSEYEKSVGGVLKILNSRRPIITVQMNDNNNYHQYGVRISCNEELVSSIEASLEACLTAEQKAAVNEYMVTATGEGSMAAGLCEIFYYLTTQSTASQTFSAMTSQTYGADISAYLNSFTRGLNNKSFSIKKTIGGADFLFTQRISPYNPCRSVTFSLSDYCNVAVNNVYKIELYDMTDNRVLDYTYLCSGITESKGSNPYGTERSDFETPEDMDNDNPASTWESDGLADPDDSNGLISSWDDGYEGLDDNTIQGWLENGGVFDDVTTQLGSATKAVGSFFKMCYNMLPDIYLTLICAAVIIAVFLRIIGR